MFFSIEDVPQTPFLDIQGIALRNPQNGSKFAQLISKRNDLLKIIKEISSEQSMKDFDIKQVEEGLRSSVDLVD